MNMLRHLGNFVDVALSDSLVYRYKRSMFIGYVNKLISKFGHLHPKVLLNLFNTYCCSFYGSSTWGLHSNGFNLTAWNIIGFLIVMMFWFVHVFLSSVIMQILFLVIT